MRKELNRGRQHRDRVEQPKLFGSELSSADHQYKLSKQMASLLVLI